MKQNIQVLQYVGENKAALWRIKKCRQPGTIYFSVKKQAAETFRSGMLFEMCLQMVTFVGENIPSPGMEHERHLRHLPSHFPLPQKLKTPFE